MKIGYSKQIQERINGADDGTIFVNSDFADIADSETTRRNLNRLTDRKSTRLNSSHRSQSRMPSSA